MINGSPIGSILHDVRHAKDLKQQPIRDKIELAGQFSGYESGQAAGEIISRKATDLDKIQEETFRGYLQELQNKYSVGETIRSNKYPEIDGLKLEGKHILEIPDSNKHLPDIEKFKEIAKEYGVELRFTKE